MSSGWLRIKCRNLPPTKSRLILPLCICVCARARARARECYSRLLLREPVPVSEKYHRVNYKSRHPKYTFDGTHIILYIIIYLQFIRQSFVLLLKLETKPFSGRSLRIVQLELMLPSFGPGDKLQKKKNLFSKCIILIVLQM